MLQNNIKKFLKLALATDPFPNKMLTIYSEHLDFWVEAASPFVKYVIVSLSRARMSNLVVGVPALALVDFVSDTCWAEDISDKHL